MRRLARWMPQAVNGENPLAVQVFRRLDASRDLLGAGPLKRRWQAGLRRPVWPVAAGAYRVGHPDAPVAVCTLSSNDLIHPLAALPGVAIAGRLYTLNLGVERMLTNLAANSAIRVLVLCGKDSPVFHTAQGLRALWAHGVGADQRILGAVGHFPVLTNLSHELIEAVRHRVELVDVTGTTDVPLITEQVRRAAQYVEGQRPGRLALGTPLDQTSASMADSAGSPRESPPSSDDGGFFIITLDHQARAVLCQHFSSGHQLLHEARGRSAQRIVRSLLRQAAISDLGHAAYLGGELMKAETALRLGLVYEQDRPLRR